MLVRIQFTWPAKTMTTIIISDIHNRTRWIEPGLAKLKEKFNYDEVVFLGDYFDQFKDGPFDAQGTAMWLRQSLIHKDRIHLLGNHDMPYMFPNNDSLWCPGYTVQKSKVVRENLDGMWRYFKPCYYTQGWMLSHAGFGGRCIRGEPNAEELVVMADKSMKVIATGLEDTLFLPGSRMGDSTEGGVTWCDWDDEFKPIPNIKQIVGHTPSHKVRSIVSDDSQNFCMDTNNQHIGVIVDGELSFYLRSQLLGF